MSDDLDLRGIDHHHEPDPQFRAALHHRLEAIVAGTDPGPVTNARDLATIDLESTSAMPSPKRNRRWVAAAILAAAAVIAIALVATRVDDATPADQRFPTATMPPTTPPRALPSSGEIEPGTYFVDEVAGIPTPRITATLGTGWAAAGQGNGWHISKSDDNLTLEELARDNNLTLEELARDNNLTLEEAFDEGMQHAVGVMEFSHPVAVYVDACHWEDGEHPGPLDTVDALVAALSEQQGWAEVTTPSDISVDGYVGKAFQRTAPTDMSDCSTRPYNMRVQSMNSDFRSWENADEPFVGWAGEYYEPGWIETLWVLDLDGTMVVISTGVWPEPSAGADADFAADVLNSIRIARGPDATPADQPSPTEILAPRPLPNRAGELEPGTYFVDEVAGIPTPRIFATLGTGWAVMPQPGGWRIAKRDDYRTFDELARDSGKTPEEMPRGAYAQHDVGVMEFSHPIAVYSDACHWEDGNHPGPLDTVDGLVAALSEQQGWTEVTAPSDISVDGHVGKAFQRTAPVDMSDCSTRNGGMRVDGNSDFRSWKNPIEPGFAGEYYEPGWIETLWVLDLDGTIIVITTGVWPEPSAGADADFAADVLDSIRIAVA